jgi:hypothetical protein
MSKRGKPDKTFSRDPKGNAPPTQPQGEPACAPLKPRPRLFAALMILFVVWLGVLFTLYFKTVYPLRHSATDAATTRPGASALPSAPR